MARVKRGVTSHAKHKKVLKAAKGFYGRRKNTIRAAKAAVDRSMQYATRDRKVKKRTMRSLWIQRLNAAVREFGLTYSRFIDGLAKAGHRSGSQGSVGTRHFRAGGLQGHRGKGQGRLAGRGRNRRRLIALPAAAAIFAQKPAATRRAFLLYLARRAWHYARLPKRRRNFRRCPISPNSKPQPSPPSTAPATKRRWKPCASPRSAKKARFRRCSPRSAKCRRRSARPKARRSTR